MNKLLATVLLISSFFASCSGTRTTFARNVVNKEMTISIESYFGCCGMRAYYADLYVKKRRTMQIVYNFNNAPSFKPTVFIFNYRKSGALGSCTRYVATTGTDYQVPFSPTEIELLRKLDTLSFGFVKQRITPIASLTGYRKPMQGEGTHPFPLIKRGYKVTLE